MRYFISIACLGLLGGCSKTSGYDILMASPHALGLGGVYKYQKGDLETLKTASGGAWLFGRLSDTEAAGWSTEIDADELYTSQAVVYDKRGNEVFVSEALPYQGAIAGFLARESRELVVSAFHNENKTGIPTWLRIDLDSGTSTVLTEVETVVAVSGDGDVIIVRDELYVLSVLNEDGTTTPANVNTTTGLAHALNGDGTRLYHTSGSHFEFSIGYTDLATAEFISIHDTKDQNVFPASLHVEDEVLIARSAAQTTIVPLDGSAVEQITGSGGTMGVGALSDDLTHYVEANDAIPANGIYSYLLVEIGPDALDKSDPGTRFLTTDVGFGSSVLF
jgi:hypothetical protein